MGLFSFIRRVGGVGPLEEVPGSKGNAAIHATTSTPVDTAKAKQTMREYLQTLDTNHDGKLTTKEVMSNSKRIYEKRFDLVGIDMAKAKAEEATLLATSEKFIESYHGKVDIEKLAGHLKGTLSPEKSSAAIAKTSESTKHSVSAKHDHAKFSAVTEATALPLSFDAGKEPKNAGAKKEITSR